MAVDIAEAPAAVQGGGGRGFGGVGAPRPEHDAKGATLAVLHPRDRHVALGGLHALVWEGGRGGGGGGG